MALNKTRIEWTDYTLNPVTGCAHGCWYCYAKKMFTRFGKSFEPTFYPERLEYLKKAKPGSKIFICSVSDLFAEWTKDEWRERVLAELTKYSHLTFQLLTKNPERIDSRLFGSNVWVGVTVTNQDEIWKIPYIRKVNCGVRFVSFEPLLSAVLTDLGVDWVIIGKLTGSRKIPLQMAWVSGLIEQANYEQIPVFVKNNLNWKAKITDFPK